MTSSTPGLIAQMSGKATCKRYKHPAVHVDQAKGMGFTLLQKSIDVKDTTEGKLAFDCFCQSHRNKSNTTMLRMVYFPSNTWRLSCQEHYKATIFLKRIHYILFND